MASPEPEPSSGTSPPNSEQRLSQVARRLVIPEGIVGSYWPPVRQTIISRLGADLDRWQDGIGGLLLAYRENGQLAHTIGGAGMSLPRQVGKTFTLTTLMTGLCIEYPGLLAIWTSHHVKTNTETFQSVQTYTRQDRVAPFIQRVLLGSGDEAVEFTNGSRILFGARERGFGRGIPGVDVLVSDEAQILSQRAMQDMLATMNTSRLGLHIYCGTPPKPGDNAEMFSVMRQEAIAQESTDLVWIECSADEDGDMDDLSQWMKANPSCPKRTPVVSIQRLRRRLDDDGFRREALGLWGTTEEASVFDIKLWNDLVDPAAEQPGPVALVADISPDRRNCCIAVAGEDSEGRTVVLAFPIKRPSDIVPRIRKLVEEKNIVDVSITSGAARSIEPDLTKAGIEYTRLGTADMAAAYAAFQESIKAGTIVHVGQPELDTAMVMARTRYWMTGEAEVFDRRGYTADVTPAVACAGAAYRWGLKRMPMPVLM